MRLNGICAGLYCQVYFQDYYTIELNDNEFTFLNLPAFFTFNSYSTFLLISSAFLSRQMFCNNICLKIVRILKLRVGLQEDSTYLPVLSDIFRGFYLIFTL